MDPVTLTLMGASLAGGIIKIFSKKKQKEVAVIDPEWLKQHFGARAVNQETIDLFNSAIASPQGQQLMASGAGRSVWPRHAPGCGRSRVRCG
jgi:hypothetical protein